MAGVEMESGARIDAHRRILREKAMIRQVFEDIYAMCAALDEKYFSAAGRRVELGAGASLMKEFLPGIVTTDVEAARHLDAVVDAQAMPFRAASVRAFYGIDCFHHLPRPEDFFAELLRTLAPGGGAVLVEPYYGPVARLLYKRLFASEDFDPAQPAWSRAMGSMRGANQALSYVVFARDRKLFESRYPELPIVCARPLPHYLRYLASGGLNFCALLPAAAAPLLRGCERALSPLARLLALHHVVVLRKKR